MITGFFSFFEIYLSKLILFKSPIALKRVELFNNYVACLAKKLHRKKGMNRVIIGQVLQLRQLETNFAPKKSLVLEGEA